MTCLFHHTDKHLFDRGPPKVKDRQRLCYMAGQPTERGGDGLKRDISL